MKNIISKIMMAVLAAALAFAAFPFTNVFAADEQPPTRGELTDDKLEQLWARQMQVYERLGRGFEDTEAHIAKFQSMIDKAAENGKDVSALQSALDAYAAALLASKPAYDALGEVITAHEGFDADGNVIDSEQAQATVKEAREQMQALKSSMGETFRALREAVKAFREANKPEAEKVERE